MKSVSTINLAIMENAECSVVKACASFIDLKVGVSLDHCFVLLLALGTYWATRCRYKHPCLFTFYNYDSY